MKKQKSLPFIAIGNGELDNNPDVPKTIKCKSCGKMHKVVRSKDSDGTPGRLHFYTCKNVKPNATYLCGFNGKLMKLKGDK